MNSPNHLVCIDIETTGSDSSLHSIIQIGAVIVDQAFEIVDSGNFRLAPLDKNLGWDKRAQDVHNITPEYACAIGGSHHSVLPYFEQWAREKAGGDGLPMLASWGTYFDINFLKAYYARLGRKWAFQRKCVDLKSIAWWEMAKRGESADGVEATLKRLGKSFVGTPHDGLDDIVNTVGVIQGFLDHTSHV